MKSKKKKLKTVFDYVITILFCAAVVASIYAVLSYDAAKQAKVENDKLRDFQSSVADYICDNYQYEFEHISDGDRAYCLKRVSKHDDLLITAEYEDEESKRDFITKYYTAKVEDYAEFNNNRSLSSAYISNNELKVFEGEFLKDKKVLAIRDKVKKYVDEHYDVFMK